MLRYSHVRVSMASPILAWGWYGLAPMILFTKSKSTKQVHMAVSYLDHFVETNLGLPPQDTLSPASVWLTTQVDTLGLWYNCSAVMRSRSEEGSYLRLVDLLYHSTLRRE